MYTLEIGIELGTFMSSHIHLGTLVYLDLRIKLKYFRMHQLINLECINELKQLILMTTELKNYLLIKKLFILLTK